MTQRDSLLRLIAIGAINNINDMHIFTELGYYFQAM